MVHHWIFRHLFCTANTGVSIQSKLKRSTEAQCRFLYCWYCKLLKSIRLRFLKNQYYNHLVHNHAHLTLNLTHLISCTTNTMWGKKLLGIVSDALKYVNFQAKWLVLWILTHLKACTFSRSGAQILHVWRAVIHLKKTHLVLNGTETGLSGQMTSTFIFKLYYKCMYSNLRLSATTKGAW